MKLNKYLKVMLEQVNISSLIFLKLFDKNICQNVICKKSKVPYPIHFLLHHYGLKMCYTSKDLQRLILVFDKTKCLQDFDLTNKQHYNIIDLLIDSDRFFSITQREYFTIVELKFEKKYIDDIKLIHDTSKYSDVSNAFREAMEPVNRSVPVVSESLMKYIIIKNIPLGIVSKSSKLKAYLENFISVSSKETIDDESELYISFNPEKEFISQKNLDMICKISIFDIKL